MKSLVLVSFLSFSAFAQTVITTISPTSGPDAGGTQVRITGDHLSPAVVCVLPCPTRVSFGEISVDAQNESDQSLLVTTPPHAAGAVDVTVSVPGYPAVVAADAFTFEPTAEAEYERVLLPVYIVDTVPGANGTQWKTDFWMRNDGTESVTLAPWTCPLGVLCPHILPLTYPLPEQYALHNPVGLSTARRSNPSQLIYLFDTPAPHVSMSLRVADVSRHDLNAGTDIPVIRESDLLTGPAQLLDVPIDAATSRVLLRIYDVTFTDAQFAVSIFAQTEEPSISMKSFIVHATTPQTGDFRNEAAYAQLDLTSILASGNVRVEVSPLTPGSRFWAFAGITNNETQLVTLVRP